MLLRLSFKVSFLDWKYLNITFIVVAWTLPCTQTELDNVCITLLSYKYGYTSQLRPSVVVSNCFVIDGPYGPDRKPNCSDSGSLLIVTSSSVVDLFR